MISGDVVKNRAKKVRDGGVVEGWSVGVVASLRDVALRGALRDVGPTGVLSFTAETAEIAEGSSGGSL